MVGWRPRKAGLPPIINNFIPVSPLWRPLLAASTGSRNGPWPGMVSTSPGPDAARHIVIKCGQRVALPTPALPLAATLPTQVGTQDSPGRRSLGSGSPGPRPSCSPAFHGVPGLPVPVSAADRRFDIDTLGIALLEVLHTPPARSGQPVRLPPRSLPPLISPIAAARHDSHLGQLPCFTRPWIRLAPTSAPAAPRRQRAGRVLPPPLHLPAPNPSASPWSSCAGWDVSAAGSGSSWAPWTSRQHPHRRHQALCPPMPTACPTPVVLRPDAPPLPLAVSFNAQAEQQLAPAQGHPEAA